MRRIALGQRDWGLSLILVAVLLAVAAGGLLNPAGPASPLLGWFFANPHCARSGRAFSPC